MILCGRNQAKLERVYDEIEALPAPRPAIAMLDLEKATADRLRPPRHTVGAEFGRLDGLVHSAALLGDRTPLAQYDVPTWCQVLHVNLTAPFILTQVLLPQLRKSPDASVIFVSSGVVRNPRPFWGAYAVAKSGLESVRSMWSQELEIEPQHPHEQRESRPHAHAHARRRISGGGPEHSAAPERPSPRPSYTC